MSRLLVGLGMLAMGYRGLEIGVIVWRERVELTTDAGAAAATAGIGLGDGHFDGMRRMTKSLNILK